MRSEILFLFFFVLFVKLIHADIVPFLMIIRVIIFFIYFFSLFRQYFQVIVHIFELSKFFFYKFIQKFLIKFENIFTLNFIFVLKFFVLNSKFYCDQDYWSYRMLFDKKIKALISNDYEKEKEKKKKLQTPQLNSNT